MNARIIIADDHQVVRQGLRQILQGRPDWVVVDEAGDGITAEHKVRSLLADLLILDIGLPLRRGVEVCERLRADGILLPILFFSMYPPSQYVPVARRIGAQGFLGKDASSASVLAAVERVLAGYSYFAGEPDPAAAPAPGSHAGDSSIDKRTPTPAPRGGLGNPFGTLSPREAEVLRGLVAGHSLVKLSHSMGVNNKTLSTYRKRLLTKLAVANNAELLTLAILHGFH
jgi:DNA-binding NarL/FixJ family response regulator